MVHVAKMMDAVFIRLHGQVIFLLPSSNCATWAMPEEDDLEDLDVVDVLVKRSQWRSNQMQT